MIEIIKPGTNIDFVGLRGWAFTFSAALIAVSLLSLLLQGGPNYGVDFAGGTLLHLRFRQPVKVGEIRSVFKGTKFDTVVVQDFGGSEGEYLLRLPQTDEALQGISESVVAPLKAKFGTDAFELLRTESVGPRVGKVLRQKAILAVTFATIMMGIYIALRFQWRFGLGAALALAHDVIITIGALSVARMEFDLTIVAALLTVVGFSVNDTVIVSDRIRENMRKLRRQPMAGIVNISINETLSRTILTTGTALLVLVALFALGGGVIHGFAYTLIVGFTVGTYSSIFIASPVVLLFEKGSASRPRR